MENELFVIEDNDITFNVIDWGANNSLNFNIYEDCDEDDGLTSMGFILDVQDVKNLIKVLQKWVEA